MYLRLCLGYPEGIGEWVLRTVARIKPSAMTQQQLRLYGTHDKETPFQHKNHTVQGTSGVVSRQRGR